MTSARHFLHHGVLANNAWIAHRVGFCISSWIYLEAHQNLSRRCSCSSSCPIDGQNTSVNNEAAPFAAFMSVITYSGTRSFNALQLRSAFGCIPQGSATTSWKFRSARRLCKSYTCYCHHPTQTNFFTSMEPLCSLIRSACQHRSFWHGMMSVREGQLITGTDEYLAKVSMVCNGPNFCIITASRPCLRWTPSTVPSNRFTTSSWVSTGPKGKARWPHQLRSIPRFERNASTSGRFFKNHRPSTSVFQRLEIKVPSWWIFL